MSTSTGFDSLTAAAVQAASAGDTASAASLLRQALSAQEAALGPKHPDLAVTLNNLALMLERQGALEEAGTCYHRAYAIASAALGPDSPAVQISRANLEAFVHSHGASFEMPDNVRRGTLSDFGEERAAAAWDEQVLAPAPEPPTSESPAAAAAPPTAAPVPPAPAVAGKNTTPAGAASGAEPPEAPSVGNTSAAAASKAAAGTAKKTAQAAGQLDTPASKLTSPKTPPEPGASDERTPWSLSPPAPGHRAPVPGAPATVAAARAPAPRRPAPPAAATTPAGTGLKTRPLVLAIIVLAAASLGWMLLGGGTGRPAEAPEATVNTAAPAEEGNASAPSASEPVAAAPPPAAPLTQEAAPAPAEPAVAAAAPQSAAQPPAAEPVPPLAAEPQTTAETTAMEVVDGRLCTSLVRTGNPWNCAPVDAPVASGALYYYTRVRSGGDGVVRHRWTRDGALVADRALRIRANPREGFRTFSQQTVSGPGVWHVSAIGSDGRVIDEHRFDVAPRR